MTPLAKPSGITLADHRQHVYDEAERLLGLRPNETPGLPFLARKYAELVPEGDLALRVRRSAWIHDKGKEHSKPWQDACQNDYATYRAWRTARGLDPDAIDSGDYRRFEYDRPWRHRGKAAGDHLRKAGVRHEFASLLWCRDNPGTDLTLSERVAIAAHHGKFSARHKARRRWDRDEGGRYASLFKRLEAEGDAIARGFYGQPLSLPLLRRYELAGVRALLRLADTRASRAEAGGALAPIESFSYTSSYAKRRPVQELALAHADDPITVLRAPTGSGKTGAALLWGQHQVDHGKADRVVIAMPTRFTANALAAGAEDDIAETGLYHSSAWYARYEEDGNKELARERHAMARLLATPLSVSTVDHLLLSLTGTKEDHHATFFFLANAAVVFDEVDFYDAFVQANLTVLLDALRALRVPVLLMSATVPDSARRLYRVDTEIRASSAESSGCRTLHRHPPVEKPDDARDILDRMIEAGTGIVYANTVERAYNYWAYLTDRVESTGGDLPVYLYHSRFTEPDKKVVETALIKALGYDAWKGKTARGIAVLTQIGEMSINISTPLMLSDLCPWDRLAQRAGRLARFKDLIPEGEIHVADPHQKGALYPAPYGSFNNRTWEAGQPLLETQRRMDAETATRSIQLTPEFLVAEVDHLYPEPEALDAGARANTDALRHLIQTNWMITSATEADEDNAQVGGTWKSRDIPPQDTLLIIGSNDIPEDSPLRFSSYAAWRGFELQRGIPCPKYLCERAFKCGEATLLNYTIGDDPEPLSALAYVRGYEAPGKEDGIGSGLGSLSVREHEDSFDDVSH